MLGAVMERVVWDFNTSAVVRWTPLWDFLADLITAARKGVGNVPATKVQSVRGDGCVLWVVMLVMALGVL